MGAFLLSVAVAWRASWRLCITVFSLIAVPAFGCMWVLSLIGAQKASFVGVAITLLLFPMSFFAHELGHTATYVAFADQQARISLNSLGTWRQARISRDSIGAESDAVVSLSGPVLGALMMSPVALSGGSFMILFPWQMLFLVHLLSLVPWASDGLQVRHYIHKTRGALAAGR